MSAFKPNMPAIAFPCLAAVLAFGIGYIHHQWFFPFYFHGDAATMQVLGTAILDEGSLLPKDFNYGNQLIFLRSSPFIAFALLVGFAGYEAFIIGSSLSIAFWGVILSFFLSVHFRSQAKGVLFSILLLIPLGAWDIDYVLGQQSHLSNAVLALGFVVLVCRWLEDKNRLSLLLGGVCLFLIAAESPIRGLLVLIPVFVAIALAAKKKSLFVAAFCVPATFLLAYVSNKLLIKVYPISLDYFNKVVLTPWNMLLPQLKVTSRDALLTICNWEAVSRGELSFFGFVAYTSGRLLFFSFVLFALWGVAKLVWASYRRVSGKFGACEEPEGGRDNFVLMAATLGMIVGASAVTVLNPNSSRHFLWAVFLMKFSFFVAIYQVAGRRGRLPGAFILSLTLFLSAWFVDLAVRNWSFQSARIVLDVEEPLFKSEIPYVDVMRSHRELNSSAAVHEIEKYAAESGIRRIYGTNFWRMMPFNTLLEDVVASNLVSRKNGDIEVSGWLDRPSWACAEGEVLYYLKNDPTDRAIKEKLKPAGGIAVHDGDGYSIWRGPRVWKIPPTVKCGNGSAAMH